MSREDMFFHYLPVNEETMSWGIYVTGAGRSVIRPGEKYPPSGHPTLYQFDWSRGRTLPEFQLVLITDGAGEFGRRHIVDVTDDGHDVGTDHLQAVVSAPSLVRRPTGGGHGGDGAVDTHHHVRCHVVLTRPLDLSAPTRARRSDLP